ncbi:hypothetical protein LTR29_005839 [Friedmanniomyces endolithicus]|nr:hypothetical protein LTR29_005839 [Friedmanniomyces endolithicus]
MCGSSGREKQLWIVFKEAYLDATKGMYDGEFQKAVVFIEAIEAEGRKRASDKSLFSA